MALVPVKNVGQYGVNRDLSVHELPINVWTDAQNIRFLDGYARPSYGTTNIYSGTPNPVYHVMPVTVAGVRTWLLGLANSIYSVVEPGTYTDLTRASGGAYTATINSWTSTMLGGIPILNNGTDAPQQWLLTGKCTDLSNWPASTTCASIRAFKNLLVAVDVTKSGTRYPYMVKWSHPADPGSVPSSWDITDATKDAGEFDLSDGYDYIVDCLGLRDSLIVYKQQSVWRLDYIGGVFVLRSQKVLGTSGAMNKNCIVEIDGQHAVLTNMDVVIHDGQQATSILDKQSRRYLFDNIDETYRGRCFVFKNPFFNEIYFCYPSMGHTACNKAMVWNWVERTVTFRDLDTAIGITHAAHGPVDVTTLTAWSNDSDAWSSDTTAWNQPAVVPDVSRVLLAINNSKLLLLDSGYTQNSVGYDSYIERAGLSFDAPNKMKMVTRIYPRISGAAGTVIWVYVASMDTPYDTPNYQTGIAFYTIGTTVSCDFFITGRYFAIKFYGGSTIGTGLNWRLDSFDVEVKIVGDW